MIASVVAALRLRPRACRSLRRGLLRPALRLWLSHRRPPARPGLRPPFRPGTWPPSRPRLGPR
eukprot:226894-Alexandrium_andersonii.AAC.1